MPLIEWSDEFSVGLDIFDCEHQKLIAIINELHAAFERGIDRSVVEHSLDELVEYTLLHFGHEEMYFNDWAYPDKAAHLVAHQELRQQVMDYRVSIVAVGSIAMALDLIVFLRYWLLGHIMSEDKKFCRFLIDKGLR